RSALASSHSSFRASQPLVGVGECLALNSFRNELGGRSVGRELPPPGRFGPAPLPAVFATVHREEPSRNGLSCGRTPPASSTRGPGEMLEQITMKALRSVAIERGIVRGVIRHRRRGGATGLFFSLAACDPGLVVDGRVVDDSGGALPGAMVRLSRSAPPAYEQRATSGGDGKFHLAMLQGHAAEMRMSVAAEGYRQVEIRIPPQGGFDCVVTLRKVGSSPRPEPPGASADGVCKRKE